MNLGLGFYSLWSGYALGVVTFHALCKNYVEKPTILCTIYGISTGLGLFSTAEMVSLVNSNYNNLIYFMGIFGFSGWLLGLYLAKTKKKEC